MCLVAIARHAHPRWPLILLANRDEFHQRPSAAADWWAGIPPVLGGRDLRSGGSWLAVARGGRFAVVTNLPARATGTNPALSRGELVSDFVTGTQPPGRHLAALAIRASDYAGFCLVAGDQHEVLALASPGPPEPLALSAGVFAFSNAPVEARWPKVEQLREELAALLAAGGEPDAEFLLAMIGPGANGVAASPAPVADRRETADFVPVDELPHTPFVIGAHYGTRCSTLLRISADASCEFVERRWGPMATPGGETRFCFRLDSTP